MTDDQQIALANECLDSGKAMSLTLIREALEAYRRKVESYEAERNTLSADLAPLTGKQTEVFNFIIDFEQQYQYTPSIREIQQGLNIRSSATAHGYIERLEQKGYIKRIGKRGFIIIGKRESEGN